MINVGAHGCALNDERSKVENARRGEEVAMRSGSNLTRFVNTSLLENLAHNLRISSLTFVSLIAANRKDRRRRHAVSLANLNQRHVDCACEGE